MKKLFTLLTAFICALAVNATELYLVGDATPAGWQLAQLDKTQMTEVSTDVFEWTGVLSATPSGEGFKILTQRDWNPGMHPSEAGLMIDLAGQDVVSLAYSGDPDTKWKVSKTAEYTIRVTLRADDALVECIEQGAVNVGVPCVDGVYQITTAEHAAKFAEGINTGIIENNCHVVLTQDLDLESIEKWVAIGTDSKKFQGTFDGQNHRILNMHIDGAQKEQGFFGVVGPGAVIKNTVIDASCVIESTDGQCMAAFAGCCNNDGTITFLNCGNEANITGTKQNNAAFVGCNYGGGCKLVFTNCYNTGAIAGGWENGAFSGWCGGGATFTNCWNSGAITEGETWARGTKTMVNCYQTVGEDGGVKQIDAALLASGELCYLLNGDQTAIAWYQTLGTDAYPVFAGAQVYANGELKCDGSAVEGGEITYSNENNSVIPDHTFASGWCSVCGKINENHIAPVDGVYALNTMDDLNWFSGMVAAGHMDMNVVLNADIEQPSGYIFTPVGTEANPYKGQFDGKFHAVTLDLENTDVYNRQGLFGTVSGDAKIANVIVKGYVGAKDYAGGIAGAVQNAGTVTFENCGNEATIEATGANAGGILGVNFSGKVVVKNCYNAGDIFGGRESAGISGWLGNNAVVENTYNAGEVTGVDGTKTFARWGSGTYTNCYNTLDANAFDGRTDSYPMEKVQSGELCVALGAPFTQNIGTDEFPTFGHSEVFAYADGTFGNTPAVESPYVGSDLAEGTYYLRNVDFGTWLGDNDRNKAYGWTSHAEIGARGRDIIITAIDGGYQLNPQTGGNHSINASNLYMDTNSAVTAWTITPVESHSDAKVFAITCGDKGLCVNDGGDMDENSGKHNLWQLVTREERLAVETADATVDDPADLSWAVLGGTFPVADDHMNDGTWQGERGSNANGGDGFYHCNRVWELWGITERNVYQEIVDLPNGMYGVQANAIYVSTGNDGVNADRYNDYVNGVQKTQGFIYASAKNEKAVEMVNMYSLVTDERVNDRNTRDLNNGKWALNGTNEYSTHIFEGDGLTEEARVDVNENTITVGAKVVEGTGKSWILVDNFRLFYYGDKVATGIESVATSTTTAVEGIYNLAGQKLAQPVKGINIINGKKVIIK